jgi:formylmethanofuran dehydrogenase subunit E
VNVETERTGREHFEQLLEESGRTHGHLCPGQVLGVKMSLCGLGKVGIAEPKGSDRKNLIVYVETDRCATDAIQSVTGCSLGKRTMKFMDYGKMAATFMNLKTGAAVRVVAREDAREKARTYFPEIQDKYKAQMEAYRIMSDDELFEVMEVRLSIKPEDMPGRPLQRVRCEECGEYVQDMREVSIGGRLLCRACVTGGYYSAKDFFSEGIMQKSHNDIQIRSKLWIETGGEPVFGRGRRFLLEAIDAYGSINQASRSVNISYRKAWSHIKSMEERLGIKLVERQAGGRNGGGASLTKEAREFLEKFRALEQGIRDIVDQRFEGIFKGGDHV